MKYPVGAARIRLSVRSKSPPIPGIAPPESFIPARRFKTEAIKSPITAEIAMMNPHKAPCDGEKSNEPKSTIVGA